MNIRRLATAAAVATVGVLGLAATAGATAPTPTDATVDAVRATGCDPHFWLRPGTNTITYGAGGAAACAGFVVTITYDPSHGPTDTITADGPFDLGAGSFHVDPDRFCGQVDAWAGDVRAVINTPQWNPAHRLWTARSADLGPCAPASTTSTTTPVVEQPPTTTTAPLPPATTTVTVIDYPPSTTTTAGIELVSDVPVEESLPVTGAPTLLIVALGATAMLIGGALVLRFR